MMMMDSHKAKIKLAKLCSTKEVCRFDALEKLHKWEIGRYDAEDIADWLEDEKFIDDARYARFYVRDKYRFNKWGRIKISFQLRHKKINEKHICEAMDEINETEYHEILESILSQKLRSVKDDDKIQLKAKLYRYAQGRGFESDLIFKYIEELLKE